MDENQKKYTVEMTEEEKRDMYRELDKEYLIDMLFTTQKLVVKLLDFLGDNVQFVTK
jgi:hypothetical protein